MSEVRAAVAEELYDALEAQLGPLLSRRQFLALTTSATFTALVAACTPGGTIGTIVQAILDAVRNRRVRKDISTLGPADPDLVTFKDAVREMKLRPSTSNLNWINQANIHANFCPHGNWLFLPWHRAYLYRFEEICREVTGSKTFALPYWNWTSNPRIPSVFFDTSSPLYEPTRTATPTSTLSTSVTGEAVITNILAQTNFLLFASGAIAASAGQRTSSTYGPLEATPHNQVHGFVGGNMGTVALSPRDPIFWTHHNMVERIWVEWNVKRGNPNTSDPAWRDRRFTEFFDRQGNPVSFTVFEMILYPLLMYRFEGLP